MVYPALLQLMRTPRLPVVDWTDAPADLNGLIRFAERRNMISERVPSHFKRSLRQIFVFLGCCTTSIGRYLATFRDSVKIPFSRVKILFHSRRWDRQVSPKLRQLPTSIRCVTSQRPKILYKTRWKSEISDVRYSSANKIKEKHVEQKKHKCVV